MGDARLRLDSVGNTPFDNMGFGSSLNLGAMGSLKALPAWTPDNDNMYPFREEETSERPRTTWRAATLSVSIVTPWGRELWAPTYESPNRRATISGSKLDSDLYGQAKEEHSRPQSAPRKMKPSV